MKVLGFVSSVAAMTLLCFRPAEAQSVFSPWLTRSADNARSGWNSHETVLTADAVASRGIVRATTIPVIGDARGMEAQPLILPNVNTARGLRDVMILPSMADIVRGVDARDGSAIWQTTLGAPVKGSQSIDFHSINDHWGCLSTGVIDSDLKRLYQVCWVSPDGSGDPKTARYFIFALNVADGSQAMAPAMIQGKSLGQDFNAQMRKQRASLVETTLDGVKTIFGCAGTVMETVDGSSGFCFAFDVASGKQTAILALTSGRGAGVWMAGQGIAADSEGNLYVLTGNGEFDGVSQWGESFLKLHYWPPVGGASGRLAVVDHWTPWTDLDRSGQSMAPAGTMAGMSMPSEQSRRPVGASMTMPITDATLKATRDTAGNPLLLVFPHMPTGTWADEDWGSAGPACIFQIGICVAGGKDGIGYPIKTSALGATALADLAAPKNNCAKLAGPAVWLTVDPGPVDPCPADPKALNFFPGNDTAHLHMTPVQFFDPTLRSWTIFVWGENGHLRKWAVSPKGILRLVAEGHEYASADVRGDFANNAHGGMPGGFCSGSSNGDKTGSAILVCTVPYGDANAHVVNGRLLVYDAANLASDGSLKVLWDSQRWGIPFIYNKFNPPVIDGGQIYVTNYNGGVDVYRLTNPTG
jgi:hypothetical protein